MSKFFTNMTGNQKLILLFGGFVLLIAAITLLPDEFQLLVATIKDLLGVFVRFFRDFGG